MILLCNSSALGSVDPVKTSMNPDSAQYFLHPPREEVKMRWEEGIEEALRRALGEKWTERENVVERAEEGRMV
jgi:hypothetical protein